MKGYKALGKNMNTIYGKFIYELNKEYEIDKRFKISMCKNGYHFCKELINVFNYYPLDSRVFEIDTLDGEIIESNNKDKYCSRKIKLIREISEDEINKYIEDNLEKFSNSENYLFRSKVAKQGYCLDKLINDKTPYVRAEVAKQGYGLDKLINDEDPTVRLAVAKQGYGLDKLISDEAPSVRAAVARQNYGLDILINDESWIVRLAVAEQKYGLDKLSLDNNYIVSSTALKLLKEYLNINIGGNNND